MCAIFFLDSGLGMGLKFGVEVEGGRWDLGWKVWRLGGSQTAFPSIWVEAKPLFDPQAKPRFHPDPSMNGAIPSHTADGKGILGGKERELIIHRPCGTQCRRGIGFY